MKIQMACAAMLLAITACQHGNDSDELNTDYSALQLARLDKNQLVPVGDEQRFIHLLKNGLRLQLTQRGAIQTLTAADAVAGEFSDTNVREAGVDENDRVQYDGQHLFVMAGAAAQGSPTIRILASDVNHASASLVNEIALANPHTYLRGMYLLKDANQRAEHLVTLSSSWTYLPVDTWLIVPTPMSAQTQLSIFDVSDVNEVPTPWTLTFDGSLLDSRRIGDKLYVVSNYFPGLADLIYGATSDTDRIANERKIIAANSDDLLPRYRINDEAHQALVNPGDCYIPASLSEDHGFANVVTVSVYDVRQRKLINSICLNTPVEGLYSSLNSLYLGGSVVEQNSFTVLHKFALNADGVVYEGSGNVNGFLSWGDPAFKMNEYQDRLRIVTTELSMTGERKHTLSVLEDRGSTLHVAATLPNAEYPAPLGKPREDIYAVRFFGERAYIVTFERIDPLYVIDLSSPLSPKIAGELAVPGYSSYLHPFNDRYVLSIGAQSNETEWGSRVKIELFDVSTINSPSSRGAILLGQHNSYSEALYDHHAINFISLDNATQRLAFPLQVHDTPIESGPYYNWTYNALALFELSGLDGATAQLHARGEIISEQRNGGQAWPLYYSYGDRSRFDNDAVFYLHGDRIWSAFWSSPEQVNGPF